MNRLLTAVMSMAAVVAVAAAPAALGEDQKDPLLLQPITVYKTPTCGCCQAWVDYLEDSGMKVETHDLQDLSAVKQQHGLIDPRLASCHTAIIDGYVVEGHVPVDDIRRLLTERPNLVGITAPGMPQLSPGMMSLEPKDYDVVGFDADGNVTLFSRY